jgi:hypothetical protein
MCGLAEIYDNCETKLPVVKNVNADVNNKRAGFILQHSKPIIHFYTALQCVVVQKSNIIFAIINKLIRCYTLNMCSVILTL